MKNNTLFSKNFLFVIIGQIISLFGNQILRYALPLYLLSETGSSTLFGTISACSFIPMLLLFPIGGIITDRVNKRNIMVLLDFATSLLTILFLILESKINMILLVGIMMMLLYGIQGIYQPAVNASVPILVDKKDMMQANSIINVISSLANMLGPVIGGILFSLLGLTPILYISAICFFLSAVIELFISMPFEEKQRTANIFGTAFMDLKKSFQFITKEQPIIWKLSAIYASTCFLLSSLVIISVPVLVTQYLGFPPNTANKLYGYAQGIIAIGSILGGLLAGLLSKKVGPNSMPFLIISCGFSMILGGIGLQVFTSSMVVYLFLVVGCGFLMLLSSFFQIQMMSYVQMLTPKEQIGKVISCVICICMCANPIGTFLYGILFDNIGNHLYFPFYIAPIIILGIVFFLRNTFCDMARQIKNTGASII